MTQVAFAMSSGTRLGTWTHRWVASLLARQSRKPERPNGMLHITTDVAFAADDGARWRGSSHNLVDVARTRDGGHRLRKFGKRHMGLRGEAHQYHCRPLGSRHDSSKA